MMDELLGCGPTLALARSCKRPHCEATLGGTTFVGRKRGHLVAESIIATFEQTVKRRGASRAARFRNREGAWESRTWDEMDRDRRALASGLLELGVAAGARVNVLGNTSYRWMLADLAIQSCGGETVPIYQSNLPHECAFIIQDSSGTMVFAEDASQIEKLEEVRDQIGAVSKVILMSDEPQSSEWVIGFSELMDLGTNNQEKHAASLRARTDALGPDSILTLIYTSGTTGQPKGVVLPHSAMLYEIEATKNVGIALEDDIQLLFLPMAHSFAKVLQCTWLGVGHEMAIDSEITRIGQNLKEVRPDVVCSVPRIFEKMYAKVVGTGLESTGIKGKLFRFAMAASDEDARLRIAGEPVPLGLSLKLALAKKLVFSKIHAKLTDTFGGRIRFFISGGAPLPKKMAYFFHNAGILILEGYGLTETSAATSVNLPHRNKIGTVGPPVPGTEFKIAEDGEILVRGPGVMREYWNRPEATREALSPDGWFATGDVGNLDSDGYLRITDRKKDLIVTAGGKNVAPQKIESLLKSLSPLISQVVVHGDRRKFLSALVTLDETQATQLAAKSGRNGSYQEIVSSEEARKAIQDVMNRANAQLASYETIKKFKILDKDFVIGEELTPTLKVKRKLCNEKFKAVLDGFYQERVE